MGIPKFFRWLSERYPLINQDIKSDSSMPEFDNLYLDMNGIIHPCTHGDDGAVVSLREEQMFVKIGKFVDELMKIVKPQQLLFLAVDGCAPRAKMNQQRQRRFRAAQEQSMNLMKARERGEEIPSEPFDSNCITPGTKFMARLTEFLHYYIRSKIKDDANWSKPRIILSGAEVPGEGEHKIMEYIRREKSQDGWNPNQRHCIYGNDADLIMLSLATHEPHFALLREVTDFRPPRRNKDGSMPELSKVEKEEKNRSKGFQLLHISVLRDYLQLEFQDLAPSMEEHGGLDLERLVDDFVLLCYLIGNDFLPHLPALDILDGALNDLLDIYKRLLVKWGDYLTLLGEVDLIRLGDVFPEIGRVIEEKNIAAMQADEDHSVTLSGSIARDEDAVDVQAYKNAYYQRKFGLRPQDVDGHRQLQQKYIEGIMWCFSYYYNGCISWGWFYNYHHTPFASDIKDLGEMEISFELGRPFKPFQQLLGVLPIASRKLLPEAVACLMDTPSSPLNLAGFYPLEFEIDMEGKKFDWEAVALIPFIDADLLIQTHDNVDESLIAPEDRRRNQMGVNRLFIHDVTVTDTVPSPIHGLPDLVSCQSRMEVYTWPEFQIDKGGRFMPELCEGVKIGHESTAGFPSLFSCSFPYSADMRMARITKFGRPSSRPSIVFCITPTEGATAESMRSYVGKTYFVEWPYLREAYIKSVSDKTGSIMQQSEGIKTKTWSAEEASKWQKEAAMERSRWLTSSGLDIGEIDVVLSMIPISGIVTTQYGSTKKRFEGREERVPLQLAAAQPTENDPRFIERDALKPEELFPLGVKVMSMRVPLKGSIGTVVGHSGANISVEFALTPQVRAEEEFFGSRLVAIEREQEVWLATGQIASALRVSPMVIAKLSSSVRIKDGKDLGLGFKFEKKNFCMPGYARRDSEGKWELSPLALAAFKEYHAKFPLIFSGLAKVADARELDPKQLCKDAEDPDAYVHQALDWIKVHELSRLPLLPASVDMVGGPTIKNIEACADELVKMVAKAVPVKKLETFKVSDLLLPQQGVVPEALTKGKQIFKCGDRIVNCVAGGPVPIAARGTVVAVEEPFLDIVLDTNIVSGNTLGGRCSDFRGYRVAFEAVLNLSDKPGRSSTTTAKQREGAGVGWQGSQQVRAAPLGARGGRGGGMGRGGAGRGRGGGPAQVARQAVESQKSSGAGTFTGYVPHNGQAPKATNGPDLVAGYQPSPEQLALAMKMMGQAQPPAQAPPPPQQLVDPAIVSSEAASGAGQGAGGGLERPPSMGPPPAGQQQGLMRMLQNMGINPNVNSAGFLPVRPDAGMSPGMMPGGMMMGGMMTASMGMGGVHPNAGPGMHFPPPVNLMQMQPTSMQDPAIVTAGTASAAADPAIITSGPPARGRGNARAAARAAYASGARGGRGGTANAAPTMPPAGGPVDAPVMRGRGGRGGRGRGGRGGRGSGGEGGGGSVSRDV